MNNEHFLDAIDKAVDEDDRLAISKLSKKAFELKDLNLQAACRASDNFLVAKRQGNLELQDACQQTFLKLVVKIRGKK